MILYPFLPFCAFLMSCIFEHFYVSGAIYVQLLSIISKCSAHKSQLGAQLYNTFYDGMVLANEE